MNHKSVYAIAISEGQANQIVDSLITVLFPDKGTTHEFSHEKNTKAPEGAVTGAATGGVLGGALGLLAGIGALAIPGVGPLIAAGPLLAALSGVAAGATLGGVAGGLIGLGIPEIEAKRYENRIAEGNILISVHTVTGDEVSQAKDILKNAKAEDISVTSLSKVEPSHS
jgi:hypothetical protein